MSGLGEAASERPERRQAPGERRSDASHTIQLVGNLVDAPELRHTGDGTPVANLTVAVSRSVRRDGEWHQIPDGFFRCTLWQDLATNEAESLSKGDRVIVVGKPAAAQLRSRGRPALRDRGAGLARRPRSRLRDRQSHAS
jgi:single-stranded DNA-binding protein